MLGLIGRKLGMTQVFAADGTLVPVTLLQVGPCRVVQIKSRASDGYEAVQIGFGQRKAGAVSRAYRAHCERAGGVFEALMEVPVAPGRTVAVGDEVRASEIFSVGDLVHVTGRSKGRGFAGVMKRHGFGGFPGSHGTHEYFRHGGSIGNRSFPGRVFKGKRMAGHHGDERVTVRNLTVVGVEEEGVLLVKGAVPGATGSIVLVRRAGEGS